MEKHILSKYNFYEKGVANKTLVILALGILIVGIIGVAYFYLISRRPTCDGCPAGQYCNQQTGKCVLPNCGNGICEILEDSNNCCKDCFCYKPSEVCNMETNKCEYKQITLTDERAIELVRDYFENQGKNILSLRVIGISRVNNTLAKSLVANIEGEKEFTPVLVTENEEIFVGGIHA